MMTTPTPGYPDVIVDLSGDTHEVVNRVINALREHGVHPERRALFVLGAAMYASHEAVVEFCRHWVTEKKEET